MIFNCEKNLPHKFIVFDNDLITAMTRETKRGLIILGTKSGFIEAVSTHDLETIVRI